MTTTHNLLTAFRAFDDADRAAERARLDVWAALADRYPTAHGWEEVSHPDGPRRFRVYDLDHDELAIVSISPPGGTWWASVSFPEEAPAPQPRTLDDVYRILQAAERDIAALPAPPIEVTRSGHTRCPNCRTKDPELVELDAASRENTGESAPADGETGAPRVTFSQQDATFETVTVACAHCRALLTLPPESVSVSWY